MTIDKQVRPPSLDLFLAEHRELIVQSLQDNPMVQVDYFNSPTDEARGVGQTIYLGVFQRGEVYDVWTFDEDRDEPLFWEDSFRSSDQAKRHLLLRASELQAEKGDVLDEQKDEMWEDRKSSFPALIPPFSYFDNASMSPGIVLEGQGDVIELFELNPWLLAQNEWPAGYTSKLCDAEGRPCWVEVSHRGEAALLPLGPELHF
ncbi:MAG: hypothetical protein IT187_07060 [Geothrix sp.]|nr:hypothetical protein [Geothrix sp.]